MATASATGENSNNNNGFETITQGLTIEKLIPILKKKLPTIKPFNLEKAFCGLISNKSIKSKTQSTTSINYLVPYSDISIKDKESPTQNTELMTLFSSFPTTIVYYFISLYLSILNDNVSDLLFHQLLANIQVPGLIDEQKYTAYNQVSPMTTYNEMFGNDLLVNHLRCFFGIQPCFPEFENARDRNLFIGFIKCGSITRGIKGFFAKLTKKFSNIGGHMNSFIIDKTNRLIIHFEPKGSGSSVYQPFNLKQFICRVAGKEYIPESYTININEIEYTFIDTKDLYMVQSPLFKFDIFCQTYSILAILTYLLNIETIRALPDTSEKYILNILHIFQTITREDALKFRNFFYKICNNDFKMKIEAFHNELMKRTKKPKQISSNLGESNNYGNGFENLGAASASNKIIDFEEDNEDNMEMISLGNKTIKGGNRKSIRRKYKSIKNTKKQHSKRTNKLLNTRNIVKH